MIYAKLDVCFWRHKKFILAGPAASGFWAAALTFLRDEESEDGVIDRRDLRRLLQLSDREATKLAERLVNVGLFQRCDRGYVLLRYSAKNETREQIEERKAATAKRVSDLRKRRRGSQNAPMVYFAELESNGAIKIGWSNNVGERIFQIRSEMRQNVRLLGSIVGDAYLEADLHARFRHLHIAGEWFDGHDDLRAFIQEQCNASSNSQQADPGNVSSNGSCNNVTRLLPHSRETTPSTYGSGSGSGSESETGGGAGEPSAESESRIRARAISNATSDGMFGDTVACWAEGIRSVTKWPAFTPPIGKPLAQLMQAMQDHRPKSADPLEWARNSGADYARFAMHKNKTVSSFDYVNWLNTGRPTADPKPAPEDGSDSPARRKLQFEPRPARKDPAQ